MANVKDSTEGVPEYLIKMEQEKHEEMEALFDQIQEKMNSLRVLGAEGVFIVRWKRPGTAETRRDAFGKDIHALLGLLRDMAGCLWESYARQTNLFGVPEKESEEPLTDNCQ